VVSLVVPIVSVVQSKFVTVAELLVNVVMLAEPTVKIEPENPLVELTGPEKVVEAIKLPRPKIL